MPLSDYIPEESLTYVRASGKELLDHIGHDELREIVAGVLCGENVRSATEPLTRRRLAILNAAILVTLVRASQDMSPRKLLAQAQRECRSLSSNDPRRTILMWILGLTNKQVQNVLRSNDSAWSDFVRATTKAANDAAKHSSDAFGALKWTLEVAGHTAHWNWLWAHALMVPIGSQTLATRGSEKSMYGKFFEKLVMGSVLEILGFSFDGERSGRDMTYWLSERGERRESDATALVGEQQGIRFDIGFIGPGNPEITLDKVSRFERFAEIAGHTFELPTVIIVDRIAEGSSIVDQAELIDGRIIQMSSSSWVKNLDDILCENCTSYKRIFPLGIRQIGIRRLVSRRMRETDLQRLLHAMSTEN